MREREREGTSELPCETLTAGQKCIKEGIKLGDVTDVPIFHPHVTSGIMVLFLPGKAHS